MKSLLGKTFEEIAFEICSSFDRAGIVAVLLGGGAAAYYAPKAYETRDLDFVLPFELFGMTDASLVSDLGFSKSKTEGTYENPDIPFTLEVIQGPLAIGEESLTAFSSFRHKDLVLHVLSVTDSVKDRLSHAIHFHDLNSARQAAEVAKVNKIDLDSIKKWCEAEDGTKIFEIFEAFLLVETDDH